MESKLYAFLKEWDQTRPKRRPRHLGADEIQRGKGQQFCRISFMAKSSELARDRTHESLTGLLEQCLDNRQRAAGCHPESSWYAR